MSFQQIPKTFSAARTTDDFSKNRSNHQGHDQSYFLKSGNLNFNLSDLAILDNDVGIQNDLPFNFKSKSSGSKNVQIINNLSRSQSKPNISKPDDPLEQEADIVAQKITNHSHTSKHNLIQLSRSGLHDQHKLQASDILGNNIREATRVSGHPLDVTTKEFMESRFGFEFGNVRIHDDMNSDQLANSVNARAFTFGNDIFLTSEESSSDKELLAHELTHVIQQNYMSQNTPIIQRTPNQGDTKLEDTPQGQRILAIEAATGQYGNFLEHKKRIPSETLEEFQELIKERSNDDSYAARFDKFAENVEGLTDYFEVKTRALGDRTLKQYETTLNEHEKRYKYRGQTEDLIESLQILNSQEDEPKLEEPAQSPNIQFFFDPENAEMLPETALSSPEYSALPTIHMPTKSMSIALGGGNSTNYGVTDDGLKILSVTTPSGEIIYLEHPIPNPFLHTLKNFKEAGFIDNKLKAKNMIMTLHPILHDDPELIPLLSGSNPESVWGQILNYITNRRTHISRLRREFLQDEQSIYKFDNLLTTSLINLGINPKDFPSVSYIDKRPVPRSILYYLIENKIKDVNKPSLSALDIVLQIFYIAAGILSVFFPLVGYLLLGVTLIDSTRQIYAAHKEFNIGYAAYKEGFSSSEPSALGMVMPAFDILLAIPGLGPAEAAVLRRAKVASSIKGLRRSTTSVLKREATAAVKGEARAAVKGEARAAVKGEARAAVKGEARAAVKGEATAAVKEIKPKTLSQALTENPEGADLLKWCHSDCYPKFATSEQVEKLDEISSKARNNKISLDKLSIKKYLHTKRNVEELNEAISELDELVDQRISEINESAIHGTSKSSKDPIGFEQGIKQRPDIGVTRSAKSRTPGVISGGDNLKFVSGKDILELANSGKQSGYAIPLPKQIANRLRNIGHVESEREMRELMWRFISEDEDLAKAFNKFDKWNQYRMSKGYAARVEVWQQARGQKTFQIEHGWPIASGGDIYNLDEITLITPKLHVEY